MKHLQPPFILTVGEKRGGFCNAVCNKGGRRVFPDKSLSDPKSLLQEIIQESPGEKLEYIITGEEGPDHDKTFFCEVKVNSNVLGKGDGKSKKEAEKQAAREALRLFGISDEGQK